MALILSIETATRICSVALHESGKLVAGEEVDRERSHSEQLVPMIQRLFSRGDYQLKDLDGIAISEGPGSYTGLRIGTSTAKGICYALDVPLIGVNTLMAMAFGASQGAEKRSLYCPMIDARRMEVYCLLVDEDLKTVEDTEAKILEPGSFLGHLNSQKILFFGDGSDKFKRIVQHPNARFLKEFNPSATYMGTLAFQKFKDEHFANLAYFEPFYLKKVHTIQPKKKF